jgi:hypothetical protein
MTTNYKSTTDKTEIEKLYKPIPLADIDTFIPCLDSMVKKYGLTISAVWGRIWRYSHSLGYSYASNQTIAEELNLDRRTVGLAIQKLLEENLLVEYIPADRPKRIDKRVKFYIPNVQFYIDTLVTPSKKKDETELKPLTEQKFSTLMYNDMYKNVQLNEQKCTINSTKMYIDMYKNVQLNEQKCTINGELDHTNIEVIDNEKQNQVDNQVENQTEFMKSKNLAIFGAADAAGSLTDSSLTGWGNTAPSIDEEEEDSELPDAVKIIKKMQREGKTKSDDVLFEVGWSY